LRNINRALGDREKLIDEHQNKMMTDDGVHFEANPTSSSNSEFSKSDRNSNN